ncbi:uncharacterized protein LOC132795160 isoform X5 [Drosophila nasuta]|uniref:uncharacterized protein LOC132795160 isoform X5 n=1 Tax=Drosophila nasuta TaxID=42062 RepID=UPI00295E22BC|nr:uncharacterized protein LOC132795160 isoform X5 [Drosophila nasuta]
MGVTRLSLMLLLAALLQLSQVDAYSKYGRGCGDIGCLPNEECVITSDSCSYNQRDGKDCGSYPTCKRKSGGSSSGNTHQANPSSPSSAVNPSGQIAKQLQGGGSNGNNQPNNGGGGNQPYQPSGGYGGGNSGGGSSGGSSTGSNILGGLLGSVLSGAGNSGGGGGGGGSGGSSASNFLGSLLSGAGGNSGGGGGGGAASALGEIFNSKNFGGLFSENPSSSRSNSGGGGASYPTQGSNYNNNNYGK